MDIKSLLNSSCNDAREHRSSDSPCLAPAQRHLAPIVVPKRQKIPKDAPVFSEGNKIVGHVNYPPYEAGNDRELEARHREFRIFPPGQIDKKGVRHIPYNSDKRDFLDKTGRDAFEVFQYTYKRPGEDKEYVVVWDYNIGLVHMTPFFKSCKYSKTIPAKALRENPGLKDISYSITGGALVCQGYWMPYQAAREIAATFCYDIRWALTPVFGNDFPQICRPPQHPCFAKFVIDPQTVRFCAAETHRLRKERTSYRVLLPNKTSPVMAPPMSISYSPWGSQKCPGDLESGYGSDTEQSDRGVFSPQVSPRSQCNSNYNTVDRQDSPTSPHTTYSSSLGSPVSEHAPPQLQLSTSVPNGYYGEPYRMKRTHSKLSCSDHTDEKPIQPLSARVVEVGCWTKPEDCRALEAAEALVSMGVMAHNTATIPATKRTRRGSRY